MRYGYTCVSAYLSNTSHTTSEKPFTSAEEYSGKNDTMLNGLMSTAMTTDGIRQTAARSGSPFFR